MSAGRYNYSEGEHEALRRKYAALAAELATWKRECGPLLNYLTGSETICSQPVDYANEQIGSLQARLAEAERDADRYRWLKENKMQYNDVSWCWMPRAGSAVLFHEDLDSAIDAARAADSAGEKP